MISLTRPMRFVLLVVAAFAVVTLVVSPRVSQLVNPWNSTFWDAMYVRATYETYDTAQRAVQASESVVVGTVLSVTKSREVEAVPEWGADGILTFARVEFQVDRVLAGRVATSPVGTVEWEAFVPNPGGLETMQSSIPTEQVVLLFARAKRDTALPILLNPESYFVNDHGTTRTAVGAEQAWARHWEGRSFEALADELDRAG